MSPPLQYVIDTNVGIKQFIDDPLTPKVNQLFDRLADQSVELFVPDLFFIESANVLCKYVRAKLYAAEQVTADLQDLKALQFQVIPTKKLIMEAAEISLKYGISAYDACYVSLSDRINTSLLTLDKRIFNSLQGSAFEVQLFTDFNLPN